MPLDPAVRAVIAKIKKQQGDDAIVLGSEIKKPERQTITSGSLSFDAALGGGFATNHWHEVCGHECLVAGTKILCADLVWRPIEDLHVGQEIVGFDEDSWGLGRGRTSCYRRSVVTDLGRKVLPVYEITTPYGKTRASAGHLWLAHGNTPRSEERRRGVGHFTQRTWVRTDKLKVGQRIASLGAPWNVETSHEAGWLAGFYDGEDSVASYRNEGTNARITCAQVLGPTAEHCTDLLEKFGFLPAMQITKPPAAHPHWQQKVVWKFRGHYEDMRFLGSIRPMRLLEKADRLWDGRSTKAVHGSSVPVLDVQYLGEREVVTIGTSTKTLIADGLLSHNSAGKSFVVLKTIAANQKLDPSWTVVWFATEDFVDDYAQMCGVDLSRVIVENENVMETVCQHAIDFLRTKSIDCIVIDSLPGLIPRREAEGDMEDLQPGLVAFLTGKFLKAANKETKRSLTEIERPVTGFIVNQWHQKITGYGDPRTTPGGVTKNFFYFQRIDVKRKEYIRNTRQDAVGQSIEVEVIKNKLGPPRRRGLVDAYIADFRGHQAGSYDQSKDVMDAAIAYDVIKREGVKGYAFGDLKWRNGRPQVLKAIREDARLRSRLRKAVLAAGSAPLPAPSQVPSQARRKVKRG